MLECKMFFKIYKYKFQKINKILMIGWEKFVKRLFLLALIYSKMVKLIKINSKHIVHKIYLEILFILLEDITSIKMIYLK